MKVTNIAQKLVCVAGYNLMPGDEVYIPDELINDPVRRIAEMGIVRLDVEPKKADFMNPPVEDEEVVEEVEEPVKKAVKEPVARKPRTTTAKKKEA